MKTLLAVVLVLVALYAFFTAQAPLERDPAVKQTQLPTTTPRPSQTRSAPEDLTTLSPVTGKLITFTSLEQKRQFLAARSRIEDTRRADDAQREKEQAEENIRAAARVRDAELRQRSIRLEFKVVQITSQGVLARYRSADPKNAGDSYETEMCFLEISPTDRLIDGSVFTAQVYGNGKFAYTTVLGANATILRLKAITPPQPSR